MSVTTRSSKDRHLTVVADLDAARQTVADTFRLAVGYATGAPVSAPIPADVLDQLADLDADHSTACGVYDLAAADLEAAAKT